MSLLGSFLKSALRAEPLKTSRFLTNSISHRFICASRLSKEHFWKSSALGMSLTNLGDAQHCEFSIAYEFNGNICSYYNDFFSAEYRDQILIFVMDHIGIVDVNWREKIDAALAQFDIVGIRGNSELSDGQPTWWFEKCSSGSNTLSGSATLETENGVVNSQLGPSPVACRVLEPSFIAVRAKDLYAADIEFDPNMGQSFLALDFCRLCVQAGLSIGTWPIHISDASALVSPLVHAENWSDYFLKYREKWSISGVPK
jgi:hypothetical protein